jgi:hypothetical protein
MDRVAGLRLQKPQRQSHRSGDQPGTRYYPTPLRPYRGTIVASSSIKRSNAGLVGLLKPLRLDHSGLLGHQRLQQQGLHLPGVEREPSPRVGVEEGGAPLLHELHERAATGIVGPHGSFQQGEARPVALHGPRPEHLRHRRFLWDDVGPGLGSAAPESAVCLQTVM